MKKTFIFMGVLLLLTAIYEFVYIPYRKHQRFSEIIIESICQNEGLEVLDYICSKDFKKEFYYYTLGVYDYEQNCRISPIYIDLKAYIFDKNKKECLLIFTADYLDIQCPGPWIVDELTIKFYYCVLEKEDNKWKIKVDESGNNYHNPIHLREISLESVFPEKYKEDPLDDLSKKKKRKFVRKFPQEDLYKILYTVGREEFGYEFIREKYWFDKK